MARIVLAPAWLNISGSTCGPKCGPCSPVAGTLLGWQDEGKCEGGRAMTRLMDSRVELTSYFARRLTA